jgi:hypothetical protein
LAFWVCIKKDKNMIYRSIYLIKLKTLFIKLSKLQKYFKKD